MSIVESHTGPVAAATGLPFASGIPGFTLVPEPFGQIPPAKVTVSGTLRGPDPVRRAAAS